MLKTEVWTVGRSLFVECDGQVLEIPLAKCEIITSTWGQPLARQRGWVIFMDILRSRERASRKVTIGTRACPLQYTIERALVSSTIRRRRQNALLKELGLV